MTTTATKHPIFRDEARCRLKTGLDPMTQAKDKGMDFGKVFTMTLIMIAFSFLLIHLPTYI